MERREEKREARGGRKMRSASEGQDEDGRGRERGR